VGAVSLQLGRLMLAQRKRHRVTFQAQTPVSTGSGEVVGHEWTDFQPNVPAEVLTGPGREFNAADAKQAETTARITCRWFPGLEPTMRAVWEGKTYDILSIELDATARREYRLRCKEGTSDGA
jgi:SPP1 family predicted phage head-tail adaptor